MGVTKGDLEKGDKALLPRPTARRGAAPAQSRASMSILSPGARPSALVAPAKRAALSSTWSSKMLRAQTPPLEEFESLEEHSFIFSHALFDSTHHKQPTHQSPRSNSPTHARSAPSSGRSHDWSCMTARVHHSPSLPNLDLPSRPGGTPSGEGPVRIRQMVLSRSGCCSSSIAAAIAIARKRQR